MTGNVPYYGGRLSPEQAYAAAHPAHRAPSPPPPPPPPSDPAVTLEALEQLHATGVITDEEYERLRARVATS
jgi:hypothetical protein